MSAQSYDILLRQVESLKSENLVLKQELQDNSTHLTMLESEASNMKQVLTHLNTAMNDAINLSTSDLNSNNELDQNSNEKGQWHHTILPVNHIWWSFDDL